MAMPHDPVVDLIDAARRLRIERTGDPKDPVRLHCSQERIPHELLAMRDALDELENGRVDSDNDLDHRLDDENAALKRAIKTLLVFLKEQGIDERQALEIIAGSGQANVKSGSRTRVPDLPATPNSRIAAKNLVGRKRMVRNGYFMRKIVQANRKQKRQRRREETPSSPSFTP